MNKQGYSTMLKRGLITEEEFVAATGAKPKSKKSNRKSTAGPSIEGSERAKTKKGQKNPTPKGNPSALGSLEYNQPTEEQLARQAAAASAERPPNKMLQDAMEANELGQKHLGLDGFSDGQDGQEEKEEKDLGPDLIKATKIKTRSGREIQRSLDILRSRGFKTGG